MSAELKDFRGKITAETDCVLEALSQVSGEERQQIAREVLHKWALEHLKVHSVLAKRLKAEGMLGESPGRAGESRGARGDVKG